MQHPDTDTLGKKAGEGAMALPRREDLDRARADALDRLRGGYDFGSVMITDASGAEWDDGPEVSQRLYGEDDDGNPARLVFRVRFANGSASPVDVCALDLDSGNLIGSAG